jgi:ADP-ribose pyrophosphatase
LAVKANENTGYELYVEDHDDVYLNEKHSEYVSAIVLDGDQLIVVQQFRAPVGRDTFELPGGRIEKDENREEAVRREIAEETGIQCGAVHYVGTIDSHACLINRTVHFFFTNEITSQQAQNLDGDEEITVLRVPLKTVYENLTNGNWKDLEMMSGLFLARAKGFF